jgi:hypothetical protein
VSAVRTLKPPEPFEVEDEIRAFDQDRSLLLLGRRRLHCYVRSELVPGAVTVGQTARVRGQRLTPPTAKPFVLVDTDLEGPAVAVDLDDAALS